MSRSKEFDVLESELAQKEPFFKFLEEKIFKALEVTLEDLKSRTKLPLVVYARIIFAYICRNKKGFTLSYIGKGINRSHDMVYYYVSHYEDYYRYNPYFKECADKVLKEIENGV